VPKYNYTGSTPRLLTGLIQGVNAHHTPADGAPTDLPDGSTIVVEPGDVVDTGDLLYPTHEFVDLATGSASVTPADVPVVQAPAPVPAPTPAPAAPATDAAPAPVDPAPAPAPTF